MLLVTVLAAVAVTVATTVVLRLDLREARLDGGVSFQRTQFHGEVVLDGAVVATFLDISTTAPTGQLGTLLVGPQTRVDGNVDGWALAAP